MKKIRLLLMAVFLVLFSCLLFRAAAAEHASPGEELFKKHCQVCHPDGGNIVNKEKPLKLNALKANGIRTSRDIVKQMRNPGPGMTKFDEREMPDADAEAVAKYILKTFK